MTIKLYSLLLLITLIFVSPSLAQTQNEANCDLCGYCKGVPQKDQPSEAGWIRCRDCLYPQFKNYKMTDNMTLKGVPQPDKDNYYTMLGCLSTQPGKFAGQLTRALLSLIGGVAFLFLLYGSGVIATSQANAERLNYGKRLVYSALVGLLFVIFSTLIIRFIAADILKIPGFGG